MNSIRIKKRGNIKRKKFTRQKIKKIKNKSKSKLIVFVMLQRICIVWNVKVKRYERNVKRWNKLKKKNFTIESKISP